jgi:hypothetical protein
MAIQNIVVFHNTAAVGSAWCCAEGIVSALREMGHRVTDGGNPYKAQIPFSTLREADLIVLGAPEWFPDALRARYGAIWGTLRARKAAWYAESFHRDDRDFDFNAVRSLADRHYFPAIQDAEEFGGQWLPFGVDTGLFRPRSAAATHDAAFLGTIYPKRAQYLARIPYKLQRIQSVSSPDVRRSFELLADAYGSTKIFVNLPALSRLLVTKVSEVMACGTFLLTPRLDHPSALRNMAPFEDRRHLVYYDPNRPEEIADLVTYYLAHPEEREAIAAAGRAEILKNHAMRLPLQKILDDAQSGAGTSPQAVPGEIDWAAAISKMANG